MIKTASSQRNILATVLLSSQSLLLTLAVHCLALLFGMWPLFNMYAWSFFYTAFYGSSLSVFLSVSCFLCLQGALHSLLEGCAKTTSALLASFHAKTLRSILLRQLSVVVPSERAMINLEQSFADAESYFTSTYAVTTGILFQLGNVLGNFLNLYHCAILPTALIFYGLVVGIDLLFYTIANGKSPMSLASLSLRQKNDKTTLRKQTANLQSQAGFLAGTPNKKAWVSASLYSLNRAYVTLCALRYAVKDILAMVQNWINEIMYPLISLLLIVRYKISFPLQFDSRFPLQVTSIGGFVQILESFAQIFRNGSFLRKNLNDIVVRRAAATNLETLTASWPNPPHPTYNPMQTLQRLPLLLCRNAALSVMMYSIISSFVHIAVSSHIALTHYPSVWISLPIWALVGFSALILTSHLFFSLPKSLSTSKSMPYTMLRSWLYQDWGLSLFSVLSAVYTMLFVNLYIATVPPASVLFFLLQLTLLSTLLSPCLEYLFGIMNSNSNRVISLTTSPTDTRNTASSIILKQLSSTIMVDNKSMIKKFNLGSSLTFSFGKTYLIKGDSGIGKSSLLIPALANASSRPKGLHVDIQEPTCHKIIFSQQHKPLENFSQAEGNLLVLRDHHGAAYSNSPLRQLFYSFLITRPSSLTCLDLAVFENWQASKSALLLFLKNTSFPFSADTLTALSEEKIPSLSSTQKVLLSCAVLYAILSIHQHVPKYPRIMVLLDEGLDCLSDDTKLKALAQLRNAIERSSSRSLLLCVMHNLSDKYQGRCFDQLLTLSVSKGSRSAPTVQTTMSRIRTKKS